MTNSVSEMARVWQQTLKLIDQKLNERQIFDSFFQTPTSMISMVML